MRKTAFIIPIIALVSSYGFISAQTLFDGQKAFSAMLKHNGGSPEQFINEYTYRFNNKNYNALQDDEFEQAKTISGLKSEVESINNENEYFIASVSAFGKYNFEKAAFEFAPFTEETNIEILGNVFSYRLTTNTNISLRFNNGTEISSLPMPYEKANYLVKMRKDKRTGHVDRKVHLKIYFNLTDIVEIEDVTDTKKKITLFANITHIEAYENSEYLTVPLANISTTYQVKKESEKAKAQEEKNKKPDEINAVNNLNTYLHHENVDKELKAKLMKTAIEHYTE
ncbi:MAG: DUF4852 domain-containing protein [Bacteroidales bacterium]|nr:DUF4852 domain-containing protein [Bacteroidales bacterium]